MNRSVLALFILIGSIVVLSSAQSPAPTKNLWELLNSYNSNYVQPFTILTGLIEKFGLRPLFDNSNATAPALTLFAPTDAAFKEANLTGLSKDQVIATLAFHVVPGAVRSIDIENDYVFTDSNGYTKRFNVYNVNDGYRFLINNQAHIVLPASNQAALNGALHTIDAVLTIGSNLKVSILDSLVADPNFSTLASVLRSTGLDFGLRGYYATIFAPTNAAFAAIPPAVLRALLADPFNNLRPILSNHIISNGVIFSSALSDGQVVSTDAHSSFRVSISSNGVFINNAQVIQPDQVRNNGVIHVIDKIIFPN